MTKEERHMDSRTTASTQFKVPDMECADCEARVDRAIRELAGIGEVSTSLMAQRVTVSYAPDTVDEGHIVAAVRDAGYMVASGSPEAVAATFWMSREQVLTVLSGLFLIVGVGFSVLWPEQGHTYFWKGHFGLPDAFLMGAALLGGLNFFPQALRALRTLSLDMAFLMTIAVFGAAAIAEYTEAAALAFLFSCAELLENYAIERARHSLRALMELAPDTATVQRDGTEAVVPVEEVQPGEQVVVRPGEKIPVDGVVVEGVSAVDQSSITGESMPVTREVGNTVFAGTLNCDGYLEVESSRPSSESTLSRIIQMVEDAEERRAPSEQFVRKFARYYTPAVTLLALVVILLPPLVFEASFEEWFIRGLTLLVIACPCALVISTPVAVVSGITSAARNGVLVKGGNHLEALSQVRAVVFDKTGTLTQGRPQVTEILALDGHSEEQILRIAAALEQRSQHPLGRAIVERAGGEDSPRVEAFESLTGEGVRGRIDGTTYMVGRPEWFANGAVATVEQLQRDGKTVVLVGTESSVIGAVALADTVRPNARDAIAELSKQGIGRVVMLTGDNEQVAASVAAQLGIAEWRADLLPQQKAATTAELGEVHGGVAMVGDGVNDAPALAAATVGIAMGAAGSDAALETADVALMADDIGKLPYLFELSQTSRRVIRQNVWLSILIKFALVAGVFPGMVSLIFAILVGDMGTSLLVTGNALRLARIRPSKSS